MNKYELMVILDPTLSEKDRDEVVTSLKKEITSREGKVTGENVWWEKKFAYKINKSEVGFYILFDLEIPGNSLKEITGTINLNKNIWRNMFVRKDS